MWRRMICWKFPKVGGSKFLGNGGKSQQKQILKRFRIYRYCPQHVNSPVDEGLRVEPCLWYLDTGAFFGWLCWNAAVGFVGTMSRLEFESRGKDGVTPCHWALVSVCCWLKYCVIKYHSHLIVNYEAPCCIFDGSRSKTRNLSSLFEKYIILARLHIATII